jgi:hypothetical protein
MLKSELEAKRLYCPLTFNSSTQHVNTPCVASNCMAWRWGHDRASPEPVEVRPLTPQGEEKCPPGFTYRADRESKTRGEWIRHEYTPQGYCGLAGHPQLAML